MNSHYEIYSFLGNLQSMSQFNFRTRISEDIKVRDELYFQDCSC